MSIYSVNILSVCLSVMLQSFATYGWFHPCSMYQSNVFNYFIPIIWTAFLPQNILGDSLVPHFYINTSVHNSINTISKMIKGRDSLCSRNSMRLCRQGNGPYNHPKKYFFCHQTLFPLSSIIFCKLIASPCRADNPAGPYSYWVLSLLSSFRLQ